MRETYHGDLTQLGTELAAMCQYAAVAMRQATHALLTADLASAEHVLSGDRDLDALRSRCEEHAYALLALQAPVARDLRRVLTAVYCADKVERMGDLAAHVANAARLAYPDGAIPAELADLVGELGTTTSGMADRLADFVLDQSPGAFAELELTDDTVDALHARLLGLITGRHWHHGPQTASKLALISRFYERFADQAVSVAKRLEFVVTGHTYQSTR